MPGSSGIPLFYVIRPELPADHDAVFSSDEEKLIYEGRQSGHTWNRDNKKVASFLLGLIQPTDGYNWVRSIDASDGKAIFRALVNHYEGEGFAHVTIERAQATISALEYKNETVLSWESFSTRMHRSYSLLEQHKVGTPIWEQLRTTSRKIRTNNSEFNLSLIHI